MSFFSKFGAYSEQSTSVVGPPGVGFSVDGNGDYDIEGKKLMNVDNIEVTGLTASQVVGTDADKLLVSIPYGSTATADALVQRDSSANIITSGITAGTSGNIVYNASASGSHQMQTNGSTKLTLNNSTLTLAGNLDVSGTIDANTIDTSIGDFIINVGGSDAIELSHANTINTTITSSDITLRTVVKCTSSTEAGSATGAVVATGGISAAKNIWTDASFRGNAIQPISGNDVTINGNAVLTGSLSLPNGTSTLDYFENGTLETDWGGAIDTQTANVYYQRIGKQVTLHFEGFLKAGNSSSASISNSGDLLPSALRPVMALNIPCIVTNAGTQGLGYARFLTSGNVAFSTAMSSFTSYSSSTSNHGFSGFSVSYMVS